MSTHQAAVAHPALWSSREVLAALKVSRSTLFRILRDDPRFPRPVRLRGRVKRWRQADVLRYLAALES